MNITIINNRFSLQLFAIFTVVSLLTGLVPAQVMAANNKPEETEPKNCKGGEHLEGSECVADVNPNVTICHANNGVNLFTYPTVDAKSIVNLPNGHKDHTDGGLDDKGDIIPSFEYNFGEGLTTYAGKNLATMYSNGKTGAQILANDCVVAPEVPVVVDLCSNITGDQTTTTGYTVDGTICTPVPTPDPEACEIEGHKYDATGNPLKDWTIGLLKLITFADDEQSVDLDEDITDEDGYYCLEWDGYTNTEVINEPHSFSYRVYEVLKEGWKNFRVEAGEDFENLSEVAAADIKEEGNRVSVQIGEDNGYIYANEEYHVDFYNATTTVPEPCEENDDAVVQIALTTTTPVDPCDEDGGGNNDDEQVITGYKFNDANANGVRDQGEVGMANWVIVLTSSATTAVATTTTDGEGYYSFTVATGSYQVSEQNQDGWEQTATIGDGADGDICYITVDTGLEYTCDFGNHSTAVAPVCAVGENLLVNGSFETPAVVDGDWDLFAAVTGWTISLSDELELWANGFYGGASEGNQNVELDGTAPTKITQNVVTVPGATYELRFDFSARPDADTIANNAVDGLVDGLAIINAVADGADIAETTWATQSKTFVAASTTTEIGFADKGTADGLGSLIDNAVLCLVTTPGGNGGGDNNGGGGDDDDDESTSSRNGGGGTRINRAPRGEVLGAATTTPTGMVLGEATSTMPVGAPNTGAGGTAPVSVSLPTLVAILSTATRRIK